MFCLLMCFFLAFTYFFPEADDKNTQHVYTLSCLSINFQLALMQKALSQLEQTYKRNEADSRQRVHDKRELAIKSGEPLNPRQSLSLCKTWFILYVEVNESKFLENIHCYIFVSHCFPKEIWFVWAICVKYESGLSVLL